MERTSLRSIEQKGCYKIYRKLFELMVVVISYKGLKVGFWWRLLRYQPTHISVYY